MAPRWLWRAKVGTQPGYVLAIKGYPRATKTPPVGARIEFRVAHQFPGRQRYTVIESKWEAGIVREHIEGGHPTALRIERA